MSAPTIRSAKSADQEVIRALIFAVLDEYSIDPAPLTIDRDLEDIEEFYKGGIFDVLVTGDGVILGSVGLKPNVDGSAELRKLYLKEKYRGRGYGKLLLTHALTRAREIGFRRIELETARNLEEALGLYKKFGFELARTAKTESRCDQLLTLDL